MRDQAAGRHNRIAHFLTPRRLGRWGSGWKPLHSRSIRSTRPSFRRQYACCSTVYQLPCSRKWMRYRTLRQPPIGLISARSTSNLAASPNHCRNLPATAAASGGVASADFWSDAVLFAYTKRQDLLLHHVHFLEQLTRRGVYQTRSAGDYDTCSGSPRGAGQSLPGVFEVSRAIPMGHAPAPRGDYKRRSYPRTAIASISTLAPRGSAATWTVERAGGCDGKNSA